MISYAACAYDCVVSNTCVFSIFNTEIADHSIIIQSGMVWPHENYILKQNINDLQLHKQHIADIETRTLRTDSAIHCVQKLNFEHRHLNRKKFVWKKSILLLGIFRISRKTASHISISFRVHRETHVTKETRHSIELYWVIQLLQDQFISLDLHITVRNRSFNNNHLIFQLRHWRTLSYSYTHQELVVNDQLSLLGHVFIELHLGTLPVTIILSGYIAFNLT